MPASNEQNSGEEIPPVSVELEYLRMLAEAYIGSARQADAVSFVAALAEAVSQGEDGEQVVRLSPKAVERMRARRQALATLRRDLPGFMARLKAPDI